MISVFFRIAIFSFIYFYCAICLNAQDVKIKISLLFSIGNLEDGPAEYLFAQPRFIRTDNLNNIYVADKNMSKIRVFDSQGKFIKYIGNKGQGPGETQQVSCMTVDHSDNLIVVDRMNRRFTKFLEMGESIKTYSFVEESGINPFIIHSLDSESYIIYYLKKAKTNIKHEEDKLLHIYDKNFSIINTSIVNAGDIWDFNKLFLVAQSGNRKFNLAVINKNKIVIAPGFYEGVLSIYEQNSDGWLKTTIKGKEPKKGSYKLLNPSDYPDRKYPIGIFTTSSQYGRFMVQQLNLSCGLFVLNDGKIIHFISSLQEDDTYILNAELFSQDGRFIGYTVLSNQSRDIKKLLQSSDVLWKDKDDRFYFYTYVNSIPFISIVMLNVEINNK